MAEKRLLRRRNLPALWVQAFFLILSIVAFALPALAHRVLVYAYAEGDTIHTESKFVPDTPVRQGKVLVVDQKTDKELLTGQTDDQGKFSFKIPAEALEQKLDLKIVIEAAMGHRGQWLLKADSYLTGVKPEAAGAPTAPAQALETTPATPVAKAAGVDRQTMEDAMNKALERQLAPIKEMLTELAIHRTSLTDILGGIGYILGIFGLWAYFLSKRSKNQ
jgi:nickel transport protein